MITSHRPHQQPHINPFLLLALGVLIVAVLAVVTSVEAPVGILDMEKVTQDTRPRFAYPAAGVDTYPAFHQSEWDTVVVPVTSVSGLEQYHQSERTLIPANAGLIRYKASERTYVPYVSGFAQYQASERTYVPIVSGLDQYHASERTQVVVRLDPRDPLYRYHVSEWFGR